MFGCIFTDSLRSNATGPHVSIIDAETFSVAHYTGKVTYDATDIPEKNRDFLPPEMIETMRMSSDNVVKQLFTGLLTKAGNLTVPTDPKAKAKKEGRWSAALVAEHENRRNRVSSTEMQEKLVKKI